MTAEAIRAHPDETGGMLLGWDNPNRNEIVVATIIGPGPGARHRPTSFASDGIWQQTQLDAIYRHTDGRITYLGDWHVHPNGGFGMSRRDRKTMAAIAGDPGARCPAPLMALLAPGAKDRYHFGVWTWHSTKVLFSYGVAVALIVRGWEPTPADAFWIDL